VQKVIDQLDGDEKTGAEIVYKALEAPLYSIVENAGLDGAVVINKVKESEAGIGFDAIGEKYVDMMKEGIIDPVKVSKSALLNAVSVSSTLLTTEAAVADVKEKTAPAAGQNMDMDY
jgi:chaperonin GroEL